MVLVARRLAVVLIVLLLGSPLVAAQPAPEEITFDEALRIGLERNTALRQAENVAEARSYDVGLNRAEFLPDVSASIRPTQRYGLTFDQTTGQLDQETTESLSASVSAGLNLFNGFRDQASLNRARIEREASEFGLDRAQQDDMETHSVPEHMREGFERVREHREKQKAAQAQQESAGEDR